jgi:hypothetical protein
MNDRVWRHQSLHVYPHLFMRSARHFLSMAPRSGPAPSALDRRALSVDLWPHKHAGLLCDGSKDTLTLCEMCNLIVHFIQIVPEQILGGA